MVVHRLLAVEWISVQWKVAVSNQIFRILKLGFEKIDKDLRRYDQLVIFYLWIDKQFIKQVWNLAFKIFFIDLLDLMNRNLASITLIRLAWSFTIIFYFLSDILRQFELLDINMPIIDYSCSYWTFFELLHRSLLLFLIDFFQFVKDLLIKLVLNELSTNYCIRFNVLIFLNRFIDPLNFQGLFIERFFFFYFLLIQGLSFLKNCINRKKNFPKNTLNQSSYHVNDCNMH